MSDSEAVARVKSGDRDAYRLLVNRHSRNVHRLAYRMTGSEQDAEDIVQETFLRAYRQLDRWEERSSFSTWLYRIAANYSLDLVRKRKRVVEISLSADPPPLPSSDPSPHRLFVSGKVQERLNATLGTLTTQERAAFVLRHFEEQSIDEIGAALGLSASATKQSIFRAVHKLRRALEPLVSTVSAL